MVTVLAVHPQKIFFMVYVVERESSYIGDNKSSNKVKSTFQEVNSENCNLIVRAGSMWLFVCSN